MMTIFKILTISSNLHSLKSNLNLEHHINMVKLTQCVNLDTIDNHETIDNHYILQISDHYPLHAKIN